MKRCLLLVFCIGILNYAFAQKSESLSISQSALQAAMDQIDIKANRLCGYITEIGSSRSKLTLEEKDDIVYRKVPHLFWMYKEAPRYMTTSSGPGGLTIRRKPMYGVTSIFSTSFVKICWSRLAFAKAVPVNSLFVLAVSLISFLKFS